MAVKQLYRCTASGMVSSNGGTPPPPPPTFVLGATKPDASNTGVPAGTVLTVLASSSAISVDGTTGKATVNTAGTVIDGALFNFIAVNANNVTIRNSKGTGAKTAGAGYVQSAIILINPGFTGTLIQFCETAAIYPSYWQNGISGDDFTARRCNLHDTVDAFDTNNGNVLIEGCYVHDLSFCSNDGDHSTDPRYPYWTHNDGVQIKGGQGTTVEGAWSTVIRGCNFFTYASQTTGYDPNGYHTTASGYANYGAGVTIDNNHTQNTLIELCWFEGGDVGIQCNMAGTAPWPLGTWRNNRFGRDQHPYTGTTLYPGVGDPNGSRYQIRYATGDTIIGGTTNYWDNLPSVPPANVGVAFSVGTTSGIRTP